MSNNLFESKFSVQKEETQTPIEYLFENCGDELKPIYRR